MSSGIYAATAGAVAQTAALDATANNIANASTAGFRGDRISFQEALGAAQSADFALVNTGRTTLDSQAGAMMQTGNPLDLALASDGMFAVDTPAGPRYTRAGNFQVDSERRIVTSDGLLVRGTGGPITIPPEAKVVAVGPDGMITADNEEIGQLELVRFAPAQLTREGASLFAARGTPVAGDPPQVQSGMLESSNVNVIRGVVDLVKVSRTYESLMRVIQGYKDVESRAARELGGPK